MYEKQSFCSPWHKRYFNPAGAVNLLKKLIPTLV
jgi:hypothetical protein